MGVLAGWPGCSGCGWWASLSLIPLGWSRCAIVGWLGGTRQAREWFGARLGTLLGPEETPVGCGCFSWAASGSSV
jgi:hypothetical protein